ncbi:MAG: nitrate reductase molybdenum cofactor assembly chaperone [Thermodesulfobium sp.]
MNFSEFMKALSFLFRYPDDMYRLEIEKFEFNAKNLNLYEYLKEFTAYYRGKSTLDLQEYYVDIFDLTPQNFLCMLDHMRLNNSQKGHELVKIKSLYNEFGFSPKNNELPDYIPLFIEFLSCVEKEFALKLLNKYKLAFQNLYSRLFESKSPYYSLFEILLDKEALDELL